MRILSIETSCDETAISVVQAEGDLESPSFKILGNALFSQTDIHKEYGGDYPMLAKREHAKNLPILLNETLKQVGSNFKFQISNFKRNSNTDYSEKLWNEIREILSREGGLYEELKNNFEEIKKPDIDIIGVTSGPGLEPALWVGVNFATALGKLWGIPVIPINHMEGHIASVLLDKTEEFKILNLKFKNNSIQFPALALLISGGHTQLVKMEDWGKYEILGETLDDAVGEAFDKVARMLQLPYPGGPQISRLAEQARAENTPKIAKFPRPMIHSDNLNFSFSGLKTSVLYYLRDNFGNNNPSNVEKTDIAREFEDSVVDVLLNKTKKGLDQTGAKTLIIAGGVIANKKIRSVFLELEKEHQNLIVKIPTNLLATDNSLMIAGATYFNILVKPEIIKDTKKITACGNLRL